MARFDYYRAYVFRSKVRVSLLLSFVFLISYQIVTGFNLFEDYLLALIFVLFLNDQFLKIKSPRKIQLDDSEVRTRNAVSLVIILILCLPFILEFFNVKQEVEFFIYKLGFILWAQIFLLDAFYHYRETHSKKWLLFANTAMFLIVFGAFII
jgi:hypothetical protein